MAFESCVAIVQFLFFLRSRMFYENNKPLSAVFMVTFAALISKHFLFLTILLSKENQYKLEHQFIC